jgi:TRAP-type uncharacterized transport system substrate-binding protein
MPVTKVFKSGFNGIRRFLSETFGLGPGAAISATVFTIVLFVAALFWFSHSAPPRTIVITSGDTDSRFQKTAERYAKILTKNGIKLKIIPSEGSLENLERLANPDFRVDVGFVQSGISKGEKTDNLVSLGSIAYQPLFLFYRSSRPVDLLSRFSGKRLAIGEDGTGTQVLALELLALNGIKPGGKTTLLEMDDDEAENALKSGEIDGAFMMGDSASSKNMRDLFRTPGIRIFDFTQADAYTRRIGYLNKLVLLKGTIDFGKNIPDRDISLISPTVELVAREDLHPALSDLLIETATEVHGRSGMFQKRGEFPRPLEQEYRISDDAQRYYKSGKTFFYRYLPFWMASFINRIIMVFVPLVLILIPGLKAIPSLYRWKIKLKILRWYRALLALETDLNRTAKAGRKPASDSDLISQLADIEQSVNRMKMPASFADQFYSLRLHIDYVRERLESKSQGPMGAQGSKGPRG